MIHIFFNLSILINYLSKLSKELIFSSIMLLSEPSKDLIKFPPNGPHKIKRYSSPNITIIVISKPPLPATQLETLGLLYLDTRRLWGLVCADELMSLWWTYCITGQKKMIEATQLKNLIMRALFTPESSCFFFFFLKRGILQAKPQLHRSGLQDPIGPHNRSQSQQRSSSMMVANGVLAVLGMSLMVLR